MLGCGFVGFVCGVWNRVGTGWLCLAAQLMLPLPFFLLHTLAGCLPQGEKQPARLLCSPLLLVPLSPYFKPVHGRSIPSY